MKSSKQTFGTKKFSATQGSSQSSLPVYETFTKKIDRNSYSSYHKNTDPNKTEIKEKISASASLVKEGQDIVILG